MSKTTGSDELQSSCLAHLMGALPSLLRLRRISRSNSNIQEELSELESYDWLSTNVDAKVVSFLQDATRFLEKYYQTYDEHFGFTCYTNRNMRREGETCYNDIIIRHFTPPRHIQQADNEMIILWHDFRHVMIILLEAKRILTAVTQPENFTAPSGEAA